MRIKRTIAALTATIMLALTACSEEGVNDPGSAGEQTTATTTSTTAETTTTASTTQAATTTTAPSSSVDVGFQTYTYRFKDDQNYEYEVTLRLSPWILDTQTDVLDAAWTQVGKGKTKPTISNMGAQRYSNNVYTTNLSDSQGRNRIFYATMTNMYFSVGTVSVKNVTNGWDFTEQKTGSPKVALNWVKNINNKSLAIENELLMSKTYYTSSENTTIGELYARPKMTKNSWGPATVVLAHAENISPKYPNGQYSDYVKAGYLMPYGDSNTKITLPVYGTSSATQTTQAQTTTTQAKTTTAAAVNAPNGIKNATDLMSLAGSVFKKDLDTAANTISKSVNAKLGSHTDDHFDSGADGKTYNQKSSKMNVMGVSMSQMSVESYKDNQSSCALIAFQLSYYEDRGQFTAAQVKSAYNTFYNQFKAKYGEPTDTIEKSEADFSDKSNYSKYYWVQWNTPEGNVWLCWGIDLWGQSGYNSCILSVTHLDRDKQ